LQPCVLIDPFGSRFTHSARLSLVTITPSTLWLVLALFSLDSSIIHLSKTAIRPAFFLANLAFRSSVNSNQRRCLNRALRVAHAGGGAGAGSGSLSGSSARDSRATTLGLLDRSLDIAAAASWSAQSSMTSTANCR